MAGLASADFARATTSTRDVVTLREGQVAVDAVHARPVQVVAGQTRIQITRARAEITARSGVIEAVTVFAGSVEVTVGDRRRVIQAGMVWERELTELAPDESLRAFRDGWKALRAKRHAEAIAAFDRATDPVVAEDASYWAAIASERAGDRADAVRRYTDFLARFPQSPRAEAARAAMRRVP